ncbi:3-oxoacyl-[acyl-carrier-protein] reductase [Brevinema andersonii]|uniref:3-oxoacyl-[acyl-carrier-protein] reductase n=1 Tax=Brevinema andersonii TaxID=34097 RepID=A0A1I1DC04_BREAD|nr:3-oxoacyl-[acyl-carrier-protein] reductase [Brevinema andersonii]SFB70618.1 3-oxoacyl-[acyl-carrier-protein] reductase [Brevinema andersonii]
MKGLKGKNAIITGSTRGIGRAIAERLAEEGANIVISSSNAAASPEVAEEIAKKYNVKTITIQTNVAKFDEVENLVASTKEIFGRVDILVNNAGITRDNLILRMSPEDFDLVLDVHVKGVFYGTKAVYPIMMKQRSGKIINISSVIGIMGNAGQANYAAAKAGIIGLTKSTAKELAGRGVNVNAIAPGFIGTDMTHVLPEVEKNKILTAIPMKRMGETEEVAALAAFLASEESNYINGQVISICGGMVM